VYRPPAFREDRLDVMHEAIRQNPLGLLCSASDGYLQADHVPFVVEPQANGPGLLKCHLAKANAHLTALSGASEALVVFQGPHAYISPSLYETKSKGGRVVPTWNYIAVHAWGIPKVMSGKEWLRSQVAELTATRESSRPEPWTIGDAPEDFIESQLRGIVGVQIEITRIEGKWKASQNRPMEDKASVAAGLSNGSESERNMGYIVRERSR
jgi:transcriptional regulator